MSSRKLTDLHPVVQKKFENFIELCKKQDIDLLVYCTLRTMSEQNELYKQGRTIPGKIVTFARGGESFHNFGLAGDVCAIRNKECIWDDKDPVWQKIGAIGKSIGLEWGGDWPNGKKDRPHFQYSEGMSIHEIRQKFEAGEELFPEEKEEPQKTEESNSLFQIIIKLLQKIF